MCSVTFLFSSKSIRQLQLLADYEGCLANQGRERRGERTKLTNGRRSAVTDAAAWCKRNGIVALVALFRLELI